MLVTKLLPVAIGFHSMEKKILQKSMATVKCSVTNILQMAFFVWVLQNNTKKKKITGLEQVEGE